jgi:hypothetical protein
MVCSVSFYEIRPKRKVENDMINPPEKQPPKLLDQVRDRIRVKHYSLRTEDAYVGWIKRFILFHNKHFAKNDGGVDLSVGSQLFGGAFTAVVSQFQLVYGGEQAQQRAVAQVVPWRNLAGLCD